MRSYRMPVLYWFTRGQGRITVAGLTRGYGPHNAVFVPAGTMHGFEVAGQVFGTAIFFNENSNGDLPGSACHLRIRDARLQGEITNLIDFLQREVDDDLPLKNRAISHYGGLLSVWIERQRRVADDRPVEDDERGLARLYTETIEEQLYTGQKVSDFAEILGVTPDRLSEICSKTCGRNADALLADRLGFEARRLLLDSAMSVERVSEVLGYPTPDDFKAAFADQTGETPEVFLRSRAT